MSRFAFITEDPEYDDYADDDYADWEDDVSNYNLTTAVVKPQDEIYSPYVTTNS
jgi:hypothetical protein